jgi:preprotein translocase subunit SecA
MDYLREGIHLRGFAQIDPLVAYKNEGFAMFTELMYSIWEEYARLIFHVQVEVSPAQAEQMFRPAERQASGVSYSGGTLEQPSALTQAGAAAAAGGATATSGDGAPAPQPAAAPAQPAAQPSPQPAQQQAVTGTRVKDEREKIGRNDPCWCGSGKKYKKCHGA